MKFLRTVTMLMFTLGLGACATVDTATRNAPTDTSPTAAAMLGVASGHRVIELAPQYSVSEVHVTVPETLRVSEANMFYPLADIVWRGEAPGNRYEQITAMFNDSFNVGIQSMTSGPDVIVEVEVTRFHALTEKTRRTIGGVHSIRFLLTVRDAVSGEVIDGPRQVVADVRASGGSAAIEEERMGRTQRVVIVENLTEVIRRELSAQTVLTPEAITTRMDSNLRLTPSATKL